MRFVRSLKNFSDVQDGFDDWSEDVTDEAIKKRMEDLSGGIKGLVVNKDMEKREEERINMFFQFVNVSIKIIYKIHTTKKIYY